MTADLPLASPGHARKGADAGTPPSWLPLRTRAAVTDANILRGARQPWGDPASWLVGCAALILGSVAAWFYYRAGLTLAHYDARAHLVVARRVIDSLTPGWQQIGAVWLPLPHLLNLVPVQSDLLYRTGWSAVAISVLAFALMAYAVAELIVRTTGSRVAAILASAALILDANLLYLQATPMTEPLCLGLTALAVVTLVRTLDTCSMQDARRAGWLFGAACLTRYEAWPVTAAALGVAWFATGWRSHRSTSLVGSTARYPVLAIAAFLVLSRVTVGRWFVTDGFFTVDNHAFGRPIVAGAQIAWGVRFLVGGPLAAVAVLGAVAALVTAPAGRRIGRLVALSLAGAGALPWYAFVQGHPFRVRYATSLLPAIAVGIGFAIGCAPRRLRCAAATLVLLFLVSHARPFDQTAPMVREAQWDRPNSVGREQVTSYLQRAYDGQKILASMASLAHYMHDLAAEGFALREFVHEGNGDIWRAALERPHPHVGWILVEERARGGDRLAALAREDARFLDGFARAAAGGGVALYRRSSPLSTPPWRQSSGASRRRAGRALDSVGN